MSQNQNLIQSYGTLILGLVAWLCGLVGVHWALDRRVTVIEGRCAGHSELLKLIPRVDRRLARIEGALGIKTEHEES